MPCGYMKTRGKDFEYLAQKYCEVLGVFRFSVLNIGEMLVSSQICHLAKKNLFRNVYGMLGLLSDIMT